MAGLTYDEDQSIMKLVASEVPIRLKKCPVIQDYCGLRAQDEGDDDKARMRRTRLAVSSQKKYRVA